jgi:hypothetical protein
MSVEPTIPELQPGEAKDLFTHYKTGAIGPTEEIELFELINELKKKYPKVFKLRDVLKKSFDFTDFEVKRLDSEFNKWLKRQEKQDTPALEAKGSEAPAIVLKAKEVGVGATKALLGELQELGNVFVLQYAQKAALRGEGLKDYVIRCVEMREQYGDQLEAMTQENESLKALANILVQAAKPQFKLMAATRMYLDFITQLIQISALGYEVDENFVAEVTQKLELAMGIKLSQ